MYNKVVCDLQSNGYGSQVECESMSFTQALNLYEGVAMSTQLSKTRFRLDKSLAVLNSLKSISSLSAEAFVQFFAAILTVQLVK